MHKFNTHAIIQSILYHIEVMLEEYPRAWNICPCSFCSSRLLHYVQGTISVKEEKIQIFSKSLQLHTVYKHRTICTTYGYTKWLAIKFDIHWDIRPYKTNFKISCAKVYVDKAERISRSLTWVS